MPACCAARWDGSWSRPSPWFPGRTALPECVLQLRPDQSCATGHRRRPCSRTSTTPVLPRCWPPTWGGRANWCCRYCWCWAWQGALPARALFVVNLMAALSLSADELRQLRGGKKHTTWGLLALALVPWGARRWSVDRYSRSHHQVDEAGTRLSMSRQALGLCSMPRARRGPSPGWGAAQLQSLRRCAHQIGATHFHFRVVAPRRWMISGRMCLDAAGIA